MTRPLRDEGKRVEYAPTASEPGASSSVISVVLGDDEDVRWHWTHYPDGRSVVTGYDIIKKDQGAGDEGFSFERAVAGWLWPDKEKEGRAS